MRVLIAEDDAASRLLLRRAIEQLGHEVLVAADGTRAWATYRQHDLDVIVSDWLMPGLDGPALCQRVRQQPRDTYTYFILLTALDDKPHFIQGMQAGADDYLTKPFDRDELQLRLQVAERVTTLHHQLAEKTRELERVNKALAESARHDPLTGLGNRLQLRDDLFRLQQWLDRYGRGFAVGLCDVDRFKLYNDCYGHIAGDDALCAISQTIASTVRSGDMTYRYGGEELLVIMPEQTAETSIVGMERVRGAIERLAIPHPRNPPYGVVTISIGLVTIGGGEQLPWEAVLYQADEALYRAKADGRNRVKLADPPLLGLSRDLDLADDVTVSALGAAPLPDVSVPPGAPAPPEVAGPPDAVAAADPPAPPNDAASPDLPTPPDLA
jgi:two-component system chemotaxis response regulator CheY